MSAIRNLDRIVLKVGGARGPSGGAANIENSLGDSATVAPSQQAVKQGLAGKLAATAAAIGMTLGFTPAATSMGNVTEYQANVRTLDQTYARRAETPRAIQAGIGDHYVDRHYSGSINGKVTDVGGAPSAAPVISAFGLTYSFGGTNLNVVPEILSVTGEFNVNAPNCTNSNAVAIQGRMIGGFELPAGSSLDGSAANSLNGQTAGQNMALFAGALYMGCYPNLKNASLTGLEIDVGHPNGEPNANQKYPISGRNALTLLSMGSKKAGDGQDCAINIVSGPQYAGVQQVSAAGWRVGIQFSSNFAPAGYGEPIAADGCLMRTIGAAPFQIQHAFLLDTVIITGAILKTQNVTWTESVLELKAQTGGIDIGSTTLPGGTNFIDFHNGYNTDYSARIGSGGGDGTTGSAGLTFSCSQVQFPSRFGFGTTPTARQSITGSRGGNVALNDLLNALSAYGLISNQTTA